MTYSLTFEIEGLPRMITNGSQGSWKGTHFAKQRWVKRVFEEVFNSRPAKPLPRARVTCTRFSSNVPDADNLAASFKPCVDALVRALIIEDDSMNHIEAIYKWEKCKKGRGKIRIEVEELNER